MLKLSPGNPNFSIAQAQVSFHCGILSFIRHDIRTLVACFFKGAIDSFCNIYISLKLNCPLFWIDIIYNHFIVISIDENNALISGCGLDKGLHFIKKLENLFNITLLDRLQVAYRKEDEILICHLSEFEKLAQQKIIGKSTIVFNNMIASKNAFDTEWEVTLEKSWQNKVLQ